MSDRVSETTRLGRTGVSVTRLALGGTPFGNLFHPRNEDDLEAAFEAAWDAGIRYFDTAPQYGGGLSEKRMGALLSAKPRDQFVLSTKVGKLIRPSSDGTAPAGIFEHGLPHEIALDYTYDGAMRSIEESLSRLGVDRVDIVYVHDLNEKWQGDALWQRYAEARDGAFPALAKLRDEGVIGAVGIGNRQLDVNLRVVDECDIDCIMQPGLYTLLDQSAADELFPKCLERGISIVVAGAFDSGILAQGARDGATYNYQPAERGLLDEAERIEAICRDGGITLQAAALQFPLRHPAVATVVCGMGSAAEVSANVADFSRDVPASVWDAVGRS
jgi:D-threo-aldose 1-dehydrogenase